MAMLHERSNEELMELVAQGHRLAFEVLTQRHLSKTYAIAARMLGDKNKDAEDMAQEALIKLWTNAASWKPGKALFTTWFYRIVVNICMDALRRHRPSAPLSDAIPDKGIAAETGMIHSEQTAHVQAAISALPHSQQLALTLCYYEEFTNQQAADIIGISVKALESLLVRAKRSLRISLKHLMEDGDALSRYTA